MSAWHRRARDQLKVIHNAPGGYTRVTDAKSGLTWIEKRVSGGHEVRLNEDFTFKGVVD